MNFVNNSYTLDFQDKRNPNTTIANGVWFRNLLSYLTRSVRPVCQAQELPINTQFFTNQTALQYTLLSVTGKNEHALPMHSSLYYFNNVLHNCTVTQIQMQFNSEETFLPYLNSSWGASVQAIASCSVPTEGGKLQMSVSAMYDFATVIPTPGISYLVNQDNPNFSWASTLLTGYWNRTIAKFSELAKESSDPVVEGSISLYPSPGKNNIMGLDFFTTKYSFLSRQGKIDSSGLYSFINATTMYLAPDYQDTGMSLEFIFDNPSRLHVWKSVDLLAKAMYSTVSADLGRLHADQRSNLLTNKQAIIDAASIVAPAVWPGPTAYDVCYPGSCSTADIELLVQNSTYTPIPLTQSVISTTYRCQLPKLKSTGEIMISILVADLVLLSAAWQFFTFGVGWLALDRVPKAHYCKGCLNTLTHAGDEMELLPKVARVSTMSAIDTGRPSNGSGNETEEQSRLMLDSAVADGGTTSHPDQADT